MRLLKDFWHWLRFGITLSRLEQLKRRQDIYASAKGAHLYGGMKGVE